MAKKPLFTPVSAPTGKLVHAVQPTATRTACGRPFRGWVVSLRRLNCPDCQLEIVKRRVRRKK